MPLHLTRPKCLLLGGSYQAMPTHAKKPSVFIYFVEVSSNRQSSEPQDIFGSETEKEKKKKEFFLSSYGSRAYLLHRTFLTDLN